jgi:hypothetical protein
MSDEVNFNFPKAAGSYRGPGYWLKPANLLASRNKFLRVDNSNRWRYAFHRGVPVNQVRSAPFSDLTGRVAGAARADGLLFRFIILADTGEGDRSQYALLPAIYGLAPDFMIINGDVAYPAGRDEDYLYGFFQPYAGLDIPVWAVPGNHEYYSKNAGEEFFEVFCTRKREVEWQRHGLTLVPQPGTYWALNEPGGLPNLVVIGVDTGHSGNLDGWKRSGIFRRGRTSHADGDTEQHSWLETRLADADRQDAAAIVLFHIPALVDGKLDKHVHLEALHRILVSHPSVQLVVCGHIHNFQDYHRPTFQQFVNNQYRQPPRANPHYYVSGAGGAFLGSTDFPNTPYAPASTFPDRDAWRRYASRPRQIAGKIGLDDLVVSRIAERVNRDALSDEDPTEYFSFVVVDVGPQSALVRPFFVEKLAEFYKGRPKGSVIELADRSFALDGAQLQTCFQPGITLDY